MDPKTVLLFETMTSQLEAFLTIESALCGAVAAVAYHWLMRRPSAAVLLLMIPATIIGTALYKTVARYEEMQRAIGEVTKAPEFVRDHINDFFYCKLVMLGVGVLLLIAIAAIVQGCSKRETT